MLHVSCDICGKDMLLGSRGHFVVKIEAFPAYNPNQLQENDFGMDALDQLGDYLEDSTSLSGAIDSSDCDPLLQAKTNCSNSSPSISANASPSTSASASNSSFKSDTPIGFSNHGFQRQRFDLCAQCYPMFIRDPLHRDSLHKFDFSPN